MSTLRTHAFFYRQAALATLVVGIGFHAVRLLFGDAFLLRYVLTARTDEVFAVVMAYAAIAGLLGWRWLRFTSGAHRIASIAILGFIAISVPIHVATYFGASPARISAFPWWYSLVEAGALYPAFAVAIWRLRVARA